MTYSQAGRNKLSIIMQNRWKDPLFHAQMEEIHKRHEITEETRKKISKSLKGRKSPFLGKKHTIKTKHRIRDERISRTIQPMSGKHLSTEIRMKLNDGRRRKPHPGIQKEKHPNWKGGVSFGNYCPKFNNEFKERVRAFFSYKCLKCEKPQIQNTTKSGRIIKLHVHHINSNKDACCQGNESDWLFAPLCLTDHGKAQSHPEIYIPFLREKILYEYGGRCYLPKPLLQNDNPHHRLS